MFEEQMRALEQQQAQELLSIPVDSNGNALQHMAASAPTTPPRVNALLPGGTEISPTLRTGFARMGLDTDILSRAVGSVADKRKSVTYAPAARSPEIPLNIPHGNSSSGQGYGRVGAQSMPASRRTSASSHDEELAGHLQGLSMVGETFPPAPSLGRVSPQKNGGAYEEDGLRYGNYNAGMMLDEQLDEEMNSEYLCQCSLAAHLTFFSDAILKLPISDDDRFQAPHFQKVRMRTTRLAWSALMRPISPVVRVVRCFGPGCPIPSPFAQRCDCSFW
jgi:hypothetical protein